MKKCSCADIQAADPRRHFQGCALREPLPPELTQRQREAFFTLLLKIGSWTQARYDQHLRNAVGDEDANAILDWLARQGIILR